MGLYVEHFWVNPQKYHLGVMGKAVNVTKKYIFIS